MRLAALYLARAFGAPNGKAEDIAQEAMVRLLKRVGVVEHPDAWLRTVVYRLVLAEGSRSSQESVDLRALYAEVELRRPADATTAWQSIDMAIDLRRAIARLPPRQARALRLQMEEADPSSSANELSASADSVRKIRQRARWLLSRGPLESWRAPR
jgi:RNA polymerase sigma factor (sigma-70 family)